MARQYSTISGAEIVSSICRHHKKNIALCILGMLGTAFLMVVVVLWLRTGEHIVFGILGIGLCVLFAYLLVDSISKSRRILADPENCRLFRKYGAPDTIAMQIADGSNALLTESKTALITDTFIMKHGNFETFVPFGHILLLYRKEHSTNGITDSVFLVVHDAFGDSFEYPFKVGKKHEAEMWSVAEEIAKRAPQCRIGYTQDNLNYVKQNAKKLEL